MARPLRIEYEGAFYHVIQRGIERRDIFISDGDKQKLLSYLDVAHIGYGAIVHTYALINNHYHLILETPRANLSRIMHYINTSYAAYFNARRKRVGPVYQGRFKAVLVQQDEYLHHLSRYIHLNPVRIGIAKLPQDYGWSSYRYFTLKDKPPRWLNIELILSMFDRKTPKAKASYRQFVLDGIGTDADIIKNNIKKGLVLGDDDFFESIIKRFIDREDPEIPSLKELKHKKEPSLEHINRLIEEKIRDDKRLRRRLSLYLARKYTQKKLNQIASFYGNITDAGVSQASRRIQQARGEDKTLNKILLELERCVDLLNVET